MLYNLFELTFPIYLVSYESHLVYLVLKSIQYHDLNRVLMGHSHCVRSYQMLQMCEYLYQSGSAKEYRWHLYLKYKMPCCYDTLPIHHN